LADVGFRRKNTASTLFRYFLGMRDTVREMHRTLKRGRLCSIIIGDNRTLAGGRELVWIKTHELLTDVMKDEGFVLQRKIVMAPTSAYTIYANNMIQDEYILVFKKG